MAFDSTHQWDDHLPYVPSLFPANTMDSEIHQQDLDIDSNIDPSLRGGHYDGSYPVDRYLSQPQKVLATIPSHPTAPQQNGFYTAPVSSRLWPKADSFPSSALSPQNDRDFMVDGVLVGSAPLSRSDSAASHNELLWPRATHVDAPVPPTFSNMPDEQHALVWDHEQFLMDVDNASESEAVEYTLEFEAFNDTPEFDAVDAHPGITGQTLLYPAYYSPDPDPPTPPTSTSTPPPTNTAHPPPSHHDSDPDSDASSPPADSPVHDPDASDTDPSWHPPSRQPPTRRTTTSKIHKPTPARRQPARRRQPPPPATPCPTCLVPFGRAAMPRHLSTAHGGARAYPCTFRFAGCTAAFAAKNEWKRHVASQHLGLEYWRCDIGACGGGGSGGGGGGRRRRAEFNRKDLFTAHVRRMHGGEGVGEEMGVVQGRCRVVGRVEPAGTGCPVGGCGEVFGGGWDARMEHVGVHLVAGERWEGEDGGFVAWAAGEGIVEWVGERWGLVRDGWRGGGGEEDAEGEEE